MHSNQANVNAFILALAADSPSMEDIRKDMPDIQFWEIYGVSSMTIVNYMGWKNKKKIAESRFDIDTVNKLRFTKDDDEIARLYNCSISTIQKRCGTKTALGIPRKKGVTMKNNTWDINRRLAEETKVIRKQDNWIYKVEVPYWMNDDVVISGDNPHPAIFSKIA